MTGKERINSQYLLVSVPFRVQILMTSKRTFICLICQKTLEVHPEFDSYAEAYRHAQKAHGGRLMLDGRQREASVFRR